MRQVLQNVPRREKHGGCVLAGWHVEARPEAFPSGRKYKLAKEKEHLRQRLFYSKRIEGSIHRMLVSPVRVSRYTKENSCGATSSLLTRNKSRNISRADTLSIKRINNTFQILTYKQHIFWMICLQSLTRFNSNLYYQFSPCMHVIRLCKSLFGKAFTSLLTPESSKRENWKQLDFRIEIRTDLRNDVMLALVRFQARR